MGPDTGLEIGGTDNPVIRDSATGLPFIPGSSLKGKMRALLEWAVGGRNLEEKRNGIYGPAWEPDNVAARLFGIASDDEEAREKAGPTRLYVRDSFLTRESIRHLEEQLDGLTTEIKTENFLNRVTSSATPRKMERVPAGAVFAFEMVIDRFGDEDLELLKHFCTACMLLEDSTLGGSGSRGNGRVRFRNVSVVWRDRSRFYLRGGEEDVLVETGMLYGADASRNGDFAGHELRGRVEGQFRTSQRKRNTSVWSVIGQEDHFASIFRTA